MEKTTKLNTVMLLTCWPIDIVDMRSNHTMFTSDMELTLDTYIVIPTSTGLPEQSKETHANLSKY